MGVGRRELLHLRQRLPKSLPGEGGREKGGVAGGIRLGHRIIKGSAPSHWSHLAKQNHEAGHVGNR